uniref:Uncharacterized protein n=1 Tax=Tanacetum cinerariifolium TaxID=118510 RepID=A0A699GIC2_TANCI|nr:hypothetical protein [Tanacetum cinerariifolium]
MNTCPLSKCSGMPNKAPSMTTYPSSHCSGVPDKALSMNTYPTSHCSGVPDTAPSMSTYPTSHCSGVPDKAPSMSTYPLSQCSGVPERAPGELDAWLIWCALESKLYKITFMDFYKQISTMTTIVAQQVALDNALVPHEKRVEIRKCNMRINPEKTQKEPTYQVVLDALALTTCYPAFLITADVLEIYMLQFGAPSTRKTQLLTDSRLIRKGTELIWKCSERSSRICVQDKMSRDVITVGSTMWILLLYRGEYSQWRERFMNYLEEQRYVINDLKKCGYKKDNCDLNYKFLNNLQPGWKQYGRLMRQTKNLMDMNIDALYNILKQNQGDVNDAMGYKKKVVVVTSDLLALVAKKTKLSKRKEKVVVQSKSEGSDDEDISDLKKITAMLEKAFNQKKYYAKPTNNNLRTFSAFSSANKKSEYLKSEEKKEDKKFDEKKWDRSKAKCYNYKKEGHFTKDCKKVKVKDYNYYKTKMLLAKKDSDEQVLLTEDQAWMESSSDSDQEINENMVFMDKMKKVLSDLEQSSSSAEETIADVSYYTFDSESESEYET